jgi:hypothetical protein
MFVNIFKQANSGRSQHNLRKRAQPTLFSPPPTSLLTTSVLLEIFEWRNWSVVDLLHQQFNTRKLTARLSQQQH